MIINGRKLYDARPVSPMAGMKKIHAKLRQPASRRGLD